MSSVYFDPGPNAAYYLWASSFYDISAAVILYYDYMLTLPREIQFLWPPHNKLGWFTLACFLNRYIFIIGFLPIIASALFPVNLSLCEGLHIYHEWFMMTVQILAGTLCLVRVYALYGRSQLILGFLLFLGLGSIINALVLIRIAGRATIPLASTFVGCASYTLHSGGQSAAVAWTGSLVFDTVIFFLTLYKAFTIGKGVKLLNVIVRDGTVYFSILSLMNLGNIMTLLFAPSLMKTSVTTYTNVLSTVLVNRLVLNLREQAVEQLPTTVETTGRFQVALPVSGRQALATISESFLSSSFIWQNRSVGETISVRTTATVSRRISNSTTMYVPPALSITSHGKEIAGPIQPDVRGDTVPSSNSLEPICFFYANAPEPTLFAVFGTEDPLASVS